MVELIVGYCIGYAVAYYLTSKRFRKVIVDILLDIGITDHQLNRLRENNIIEDTKSTTVETVDVKFEEHGDNLYAFTVETDWFLGQGKTLSELIDRIRECYPNGVKINITVEHGLKLYQKYKELESKG
jgi:hypothetical protein